MADKTVMTKENLKQAFPDLYQSIEQDAYDNGLAEGLTRGKEEGLTTGAECERSRIRGVESQVLPGHEALIQALKYDGKSTEADAALAIVKAEKELRGAALADFRSDGPAPLTPSTPPVSEPSAKTAEKELESIIAEKRKNNPDLTYSKAFAEAQKEHPDLVKLYRKEV
jgi:hypothetical protein